MGINSDKVMKWIKENFVIDKFEVIDFPLMPGGKILKDKNGDELLVYNDVFNDQIKWDIKKNNHQI